MTRPRHFKDGWQRIRSKTGSWIKLRIGSRKSYKHIQEFWQTWPMYCKTRVVILLPHKCQTYSSCVDVLGLEVLGIFWFVIRPVDQVALLPLLVSKPTNICTRPLTLTNLLFITLEGQWRTENGTNTSFAACLILSMPLRTSCALAVLALKIIESLFKSQKQQDAG